MTSTSLVQRRVLTSTARVPQRVKRRVHASTDECARALHEHGTSAQAFFSLPPSRMRGCKVVMPNAKSCLQRYLCHCSPLPSLMRGVRYCATVSSAHAPQTQAPLSQDCDDRWSPSRHSLCWNTRQAVPISHIPPRTAHMRIACTRLHMPYD